LILRNDPSGSFKSPSSRNKSINEVEEEVSNNGGSEKKKEKTKEPPKAQPSTKSIADIMKEKS